MEHAKKISPRRRNLAVRYIKGFSLRVAGPGARDAMPDEQKHHVREYGPTFLTDKSGRCVLASIVNGADCLKGRNAAIQAADIVMGESVPGRLFPNLDASGNVVRRLGPGLSYRKVKASQMPSDRLRWLANLENSVWIVRLVGNNEVDHSVVIDGNRKLVIDSSEQFPMRLSVEALKLCGGEGVGQLRVAQVKQLVHARSPERDELLADE